MEKLTIGLLLLLSFLYTSHARTQPTSTASAAAGNKWVRTRVRGSENITKLTFYVHDVRGEGSNATTVESAAASVTPSSNTSFGQIKVYDDLATAAPEIESEEVARAQGIAISADLGVRAITMTLNFVIKAGEFSGSTVTVVGRNPVGEASREMPVVGGTGVFRSARGYAVTSTYYDSAEYSVLEYTVYATFNSSDVGLWSDMWSDE